jgi:phosphatidylserine decarboxylase
MAQTLQEWLDNEVVHVKSKTLDYLSSMYFHRVESRSTPIDSNLMFTPADGVILGAFENIKAHQSLIQVKGVNFSLRDLLDDEELKGNFLVVSIFMTFYSQHQNYMPFSGNRVFSEMPPLQTFNKPMLKVEQDLLKGVINPEFQEDYLRKNGREISIVNAPKIGQEYMMVRVADYDVDSFVNWRQKDGEASMPYVQNDRFGMITYGSQCILIVEQLKNGCKFKLRPEAQVGNYVKCKKDPLVTIEY